MLVVIEARTSATRYSLVPISQLYDFGVDQHMQGERRPNVFVDGEITYVVFAIKISLLGLIVIDI